MDSNEFLAVSDHIFCFDRPKWWLDVSYVYIKMQKPTIFIIAVCVLFLKKTSMAQEPKSLWEIRVNVGLGEG